MPGSNTTKLTPEEVSQVGRKHDAVATDVTGLQRTLDGNIQTLTTVNSGAMMTKLAQVHQDWNQTTTDIVNQLHTMAQTLTSVAERLRSKDEQGAAGVGLHH